MAHPGCEAVFHLAAVMDHGKGREVLERVNVVGTRNALAVARKVGVGRFVHVSTAAVLAGSASLVDVDESRTLPERPVGLYPRTKALAEQEVLAARAPGFEVVIVRPSFVWGRGDTANLPQLVDSARQKRFSWIDGGRFRFSTCHVRNLCEGLVRAGQRGQDGGVYYL